MACVGNISGLCIVVRDLNAAQKGCYGKTFSLKVSRLYILMVDFDTNCKHIHHNIKVLPNVHCIRNMLGMRDVNYHAYGLIIFSLVLRKVENMGSKLEL